LSVRNLFDLKNALNRADFLAARGVEVPHTLDASSGVDDVNLVAFSDRARRAFRLASAAVDAILVDVKRQPNLQIF